MAAELQLIVDPAPSQGSHDHGWMKASATFMPGADGCVQKLANEPPFEQGYQLARWLRAQLQIEDREAFEPEKLLADEGVKVEEYDLDSAEIDAIACWGAIDPLILLNRNEKARAATPNGRRSTLAHEICHLLIDRTRALPVAEVLGGEVDDESEKRANAFAAELLTTLGGYSGAVH